LLFGKKKEWDKHKVFSSVKKNRIREPKRRRDTCFCNIKKRPTGGESFEKKGWYPFANQERDFLTLISKRSLEVRGEG